MISARALPVTIVSAFRRNLNIFNAPVKSGQLHPGVSKASSVLFDRCNLLPALEMYGDYNRVNVFNVMEEPELNLKKAIQRSSDLEDVVLTIGGDHLTEYYSIAAQLERYGALNMGVVWVDTHADINTKSTSMSGSEHGMVVAGLLGLEKALRGLGVTQEKHRLRSDSIVYVGARDIDPLEVDIINSLGIRVYTSEEVHKKGVDWVMDEVLYRDLAHTDFIHMSYDVDVIDPEVFPCTGTPFPGGMSYDQAIGIADAIRRDPRLVSMGLVEFNPDLAKTDMESHRCGVIATDIILSSLAYNPFRH